TGLSSISFDLAPKRIELLKDILPRLSRLAFTYRKSGDLLDLQRTSDEITKAAKIIGLTWEIAYLEEPEQIEPIFARLAKDGFDAAYISPGPFSYAYRVQISDMAR